MLALVLVVCVIVFWFLVVCKHPRGFPPGPRLALPIAGCGLQLGGPLSEAFPRLQKKYGDIYGMWLGPFRNVVVSSPELIQEVGAKEEFSGRFFFDGAKEIRGGTVRGGFPGILQASGQTWREQRRFSLHTLRNLGLGKQQMATVIQEEAQELCRSLEELQGEPIGLRGMFTLPTLNTLWRVTTGEKLSNENPKVRDLWRLLEETFENGAKLLPGIFLIYAPLRMLDKKFKLFAGTPTFKKMLSIAEDTIRDHLRTFQEDHLRDFVDHYIKEINEKSRSAEDSTFKDEEGWLNFKNVIIDFLMAGSETTSSSLSYAMLFMVLHPDIQAKVQAELDEVTGRGARMITSDDRTKTPYTEAVIHEIQRLGNITPIGVNHCATRDGYLGGFFVPKDTQVFCNLGVVHHDPKHFPEPYKFDPNRYLSGNGDRFQPHPMVIPFGLGKRRCLGENLAKEQLYVFFTNILARFRVLKEHYTDVLSVEPVYGFTLTPKACNIKLLLRY